MLPIKQATTQRAMKNSKEMKINSIDPSNVRNWREADEKVTMFNTKLKQKFDNYPERYGALLTELTKIIRMYGRLKQEYDNLKEGNE